jgi:hypothetical protein
MGNFVSYPTRRLSMNARIQPIVPTQLSIELLRSLSDNRNIQENDEKTEIESQADTEPFVTERNRHL